MWRGACEWVRVVSLFRKRLFTKRARTDELCLVSQEAIMRAVEDLKRRIPTDEEIAANRSASIYSRGLWL